MTIYSIYRATNTVTNKVYIGFAKNVHKRINEHRASYLKEDTKFYRAARKHGFDTFIFDIIYQSTDGNHTLKTMESYFIDYYNSYHKGYNSTLGGDGRLGYRKPEHLKVKKIYVSTLDGLTPEEIHKKRSEAAKKAAANIETKTANSSIVIYYFI